MPRSTSDSKAETLAGTSWLLIDPLPRTTTAAHKRARQGGTFTYALGNLRVSKIDVPRSKVLVVCSPDGHITVKATDISAHLKGSPTRVLVRRPTRLCVT